MNPTQPSPTFWEQLRLSSLHLWNEFVDILPAFMLGILVLTLFVFLGSFAKRVVKNRFAKRYNDKLLSNFSGDLIKWILFIIGGMIALHVMGFGSIVTSVLAGAGVSAIIFGFAFKDIAENFLAGMLLAINRPFNVGDLVEVDGHRGTVKRLELRSTHLRVVDGSDIFIPNSLLIKAVLTNYTRDGLFRLEFSIGLDPEANLDHAVQMIMDLLQSDEGVLKDPAPSVVVDELGTNAVNVLVQFWIDAFKAKTAPEFTGPEVKSRIITAVRNLMLKNQIGMPANVIEHKMFHPGEPLEVRLVQD